MKKILLCCSTGVTTGLLVSKLNALIAAQDAGYEVEALPLAEAIDKIAEAHVVLLAPQIGFAVANLKEATTSPVLVIDPDAYARADVAAILDEVKAVA